MKNITFSAKEELIEKARDHARAKRSTLNALFRTWLEEMVEQEEAEQRLQELEIRMEYAQSGCTFTREEMNVR